MLANNDSNDDDDATSGVAVNNKDSANNKHTLQPSQNR